ncbi:MAG: GxxExxY protein [Terriglobales bacterium]
MSPWWWQAQALPFSESTFSCLGCNCPRERARAYQALPRPRTAETRLSCGHTCWSARGLRGSETRLGYRIDLLAEGSAVVEIKCVDAIHPVHEAQLLSYLRLSGKSVGLLINFHVARLKDGIKRMVDGRDWDK